MAVWNRIQDIQSDRLSDWDNDVQNVIVAKSYRKEKWRLSSMRRNWIRIRNYLMNLDDIFQG